MNGTAARKLRKYALQAYPPAERKNKTVGVHTFLGKEITGVRAMVVGPRGFYQFAKKLYLKTPRPLRHIALSSVSAAGSRELYKMTRKK